ncbi:hypothetical protein MTR67_033235, partial [Solanum verrucosum]
MPGLRRVKDYVDNDEEIGIKRTTVWIGACKNCLIQLGEALHSDFHRMLFSLLRRPHLDCFTPVTVIQTRQWILCNLGNILDQNGSESKFQDLDKVFEQNEALM